MKTQLKLTIRNKVILMVILLLNNFLFLVTATAQENEDSLSVIKYFNKTTTSFKVVYTNNLTGVLKQGICYSTGNNPTLTSTHITTDHWKATDTLEITGLIKATKYYCSIYAITSSDTIYKYGSSVYTLADEPSTNCGIPTINSIDSTNVNIAFTKHSDANRILAVVVAGNIPVDPTLIIDGEQTADLKQSIEHVDLIDIVGSPYTYNNFEPNTTYTLSLFPAFRSIGKPQTINYLTTGEISAITFTTHKATPTIQTSQISADAVTNSSANIVWVNGNGQGRIIYINDTDSFINPTNGQYPSVNSTYSGSGQQAIYIGPDSNITVSGLNIKSTYYIRAYEFNETTENDPLYNISTAECNPITFIMPYPSPQTQDSNIVFSHITHNSINLSWSKGVGMNRIVVLNTSNTFTTPINNTNYSANNIWNNNGEQVVYNGSGNSLTVANLSANTQYFFRVYAYNDESQYAVFNTSESFKNPNSTYTKAITPSQQDYNIEYSNVTATSATISWTRGNGTYSLVCMNTTNSFLTPSDGTKYTTNSEWQNSGSQWVYTGSQTSVNITGLSIGNTYHFKVFAYNGNINTVYKLTSANNNPDFIQLGGTNSWIGQISESWEVNKNWSLKYIPISDNDVVVQGATNYPILSLSTSVKDLTILSNGQLSIDENVTLIVNGNLTLNGNSSSSGSMVVGEHGNVNVTGTTYLTRNTGNTSEWHIASIPNNNKKINQFNGYYINSWSESSGWKQLNSADSVEKMKGYSIKTFNRDTIRFVGDFNNGPQSLVVTNSDIGNDDSGWNMVGNPYPSAIDWSISEGWDRPNINQTVYKYDIGNGDYATYNYETGVGVPENTNGIIPAGNGFFVLSEVALTTLEINNNARVHSSDPYLKHDTNSLERILRISITNGFFKDETAILFHPKAINEINPDIDAFKLPSLNENKLQIYSVRGVQNRKMTLSSINEKLLNTLQDGDFIEIPIGYKNNQGLPSKLILNKNTIEQDFEVYLFNKNTGIYHNLNRPYDLLREEESSNETFSIRIMPKGGSVNINSIYAKNINVYAIKDKINISSNEPITGTITLYDVAGRMVYFEQLNNVSNHTIKNNNKSGIFVVLINDKQNNYSKLLFVE